MVPFDTAIQIEARWFTNILMNPRSEAMIRSLFINKEALEKGANRPDVVTRPSRRSACWGAGMMGRGHRARLGACDGIEVVLLDTEAGGSGQGQKPDRRLHGQRHRTPQSHRRQEGSDAGFDHEPRPILTSLSGCDLIVEAVFEDVGVKAEMTKKVEAVVGEDCIFATNTSTLPIIPELEAQMPARCAARQLSDIGPVPL